MIQGVFLLWNLAKPGAPSVANRWAHFSGPASPSDLEPPSALPPVQAPLCPGNCFNCFLDPGLWSRHAIKRLANDISPLLSLPRSVVSP